MGKAQTLAPKPSPAPSGNTNTLSTFMGGLQSNIYFRPPRGFHCWVQQDSAGMFWFDSGGTNTMYYHNGTTRVQIGAGGGSGTVTSITAGTGLTGGTITTSGTIRLDTGFAATQSDLNTVADNAFSDLADTAAAIRGAIPSVAGYATTTALADSVSGRMKYSDTVSLSNRINAKGTGSVTSAAISNAFGISFTGSPITTTGTFTPTVDTSKIASVASVNVKQNYSDTATWDATRSWVLGQIPSVTGYVPYTGATQAVNLGAYSLTTNRTTVDTVKAKSSMGLHLHGTGGTGIMIGAGGGGNITFDDYKTTTTGDSVLSTNSAGAIMQYNLKGKLANYALTSAVADSVIGRQKYSDTSTFDATRSWVVSRGYGASTTIAAGTGISVSGSAPTYTVTNTAPDQTVSLTGAGTVSVTGTYPTFTVTGTGSAGGVAAITSTNSTMQVTGTTTVNVEVDTTHPFTFTGVNTFTRDITVDSVVFGTGGGLSTNIKIGRTAFAAPTTATGVVAIGENAGRLVTTGQNDIYIGRNAAGNSGTAVSGHVGIGTGNLNYSTGDNNVAIGNNVMARAVAWNGLANVGVGINAGNVMTTATSNTFIGSGTAAALTSGATNTFLGVGSGSAMTTGSSNVILGGYSGNVAVDIRTSSNRMILSDGAGNIRAYHNATNWLIGTVTDGSTGLVQISGSLGLNTAGNKINIAEGSGTGAIGTVTLIAGQGTVSTSAIGANSRVMLTGVSTAAPPCATCGTLSLGTITAGSQFIINSSLSTDTRVVQYIIFN